MAINSETFCAVSIQKSRCEKYVELNSYDIKTFKNYMIQSRQLGLAPAPPQMINGIDNEYKHKYNMWVRWLFHISKI